jgi:hypothetical protein
MAQEIGVTDRNEIEESLGRAACDHPLYCESQWGDCPLWFVCTLWLFRCSRYTASSII